MIKNLEQFIYIKYNYFVYKKINKKLDLLLYNIISRLLIKLYNLKDYKNYIKLYSNSYKK